MIGICDPRGHTFLSCLSTTMFVLVTTVVIGGCSGGGRGSQVKVNTSSSVTELLNKLPNLKPFGVESCTYTIEKSSVDSRVPSPSDVRVELKGSAQLSETGFRAIKSQLVWAAIPRDRVPVSLVDVVPDGDLLYSPKLNESFAENPTFAHGFVVMCAQDGARTIFFLSRDLDHPIE